MDDNSSDSVFEKGNDDCVNTLSSSSPGKKRERLDGASSSSPAVPSATSSTFAAAAENGTNGKMALEQDTDEKMLLSNGQSTSEAILPPWVAELEREIMPDTEHGFCEQAMDLLQEWNGHGTDTEENKTYRKGMHKRIHELVEHYLTNNAETEACDLLIGHQLLDMLLELAKQPKYADMNYERICLYLLTLSRVPPENIKLVEVAKELYLNYGKQIEEWNQLKTHGKGMHKRMQELVEHYLTNNAEIEACDLLIELGLLDMLLELAKQPKYADLNYERICLHLLSRVPPANIKLVEVAKELYLNYCKKIEALRCAMKMNDFGAVGEIFGQCTDSTLKKQMAMMLGRQQMFLGLDDDRKNALNRRRGRIFREFGRDFLHGVPETIFLTELNGNVHLHTHFLALARELDIMAPIAPDDVFKSYRKIERPNMARHTMASSFVNGFVNCGFGSDSLFESDDKDIADLLGKHKEWDAFSFVATYGLIHHWSFKSMRNWDILLQNNNNAFIEGGALLADAIAFFGIQDEKYDLPYGMLRSELLSKELPMRVAATFGLGLAYANNKRCKALTKDKSGSVVSHLFKVLNDVGTGPSSTPEVKALAALSLGLVMVGTGKTPPPVKEEEELFSGMEVVDRLLNYLQSADLDEQNARFVALGIGLIFLGKQHDFDDTIREALRRLPAPFGEMAATLVEVCAFAGTGSVRMVQKMLHICSEHTAKMVEENKKEEEKQEQKRGKRVKRRRSRRSQKQRANITAPPQQQNAAVTAPNGTTTTTMSTEAATKGGKADEQMEVDGEGMGTAADEGGVSQQQHQPAVAAGTSASSAQSSATDQGDALNSLVKQAIATLGISLITMGDDIGTQKSLRIFDQLTRHGDLAIRRAVPLALALLSTSNPQLTVIETLSKYSHDADMETARNAIFALGVVGAGTKNAYIIVILDQLVSVHSKDQNTTMLVRIAQGLVHLGKGTQTLNPFHSDRRLMCPTAVAALLTTCLAFIDSEKLILNGHQHYLFFTLVAAIQPRMLVTVVQDPSDPNRLVQKAVTVRVSQSEDVVAQASNPHALFGPQTRNTPLLLAYGERAELADDGFEPFTPILEGIVIGREVSRKDAATNTD